ncbi:alpha-(1,3)-fucosyltransferase 10-like [Littorina saxatilis]|uniref:alpha-(1,3)-fucosyltransferase 10-like n=1 Tax=Littorina saxatilis TaxID=31220 RepID=UPI0038B6A9DB
MRWGRAIRKKLHPSAGDWHLFQPSSGPPLEPTESQLYSSEEQDTFSLQSSSAKVQNKAVRKEKKEGDAVPLILWWDPISGYSGDDVIRCQQLTCHVTTDREKWLQNDVTMLSFYGPSLSCHELPLPRREGDLWSLYHDESPKNRDFLFSHQSVMELFNYTATFQRTSDFPFPTQWLDAESDITSSEYVVPVSEKTRLRTTDKLAPVLYVQSDCGAPSDRDHFVSMLQRYVTVDSYGACLNNRQFPNYTRLSFDGKGDMSPMTSEEFYRFAARYKFAIAIENAACPDYVTEKLWRPLQLGVVPIVFGAPNIKDFLPTNHSALVVEDFESMEVLAAAIHHYDKDDQLYASLMPHKHNGLISNPTLKQLLHRRPQNGNVRTAILEDYDCFLCQKLHKAIEQHKSGKSISKSVGNNTHNGCEKPGEFGDSGKYIRGESSANFYHVPWRFGEAAACVMRKLIEQNRHVPQETFDAMVARTADNFERECSS